MVFSRKKTLLSLAKLHFALEEKIGPDVEAVRADIDRLEMELALLMHQEQLPATLLQSYGLDPDTMRVLTAEELIEMYTSDENVMANELDFKKAFDLLNFIEDLNEQKTSLRSNIWARAILRDPWTQLDTDNVLQSITSTIFFKIIDFSMSTGNSTFYFSKLTVRFNT